MRLNKDAATDYLSSVRREFNVGNSINHWLIQSISLNANCLVIFPCIGEFGVGQQYPLVAAHSVTLHQDAGKMCQLVAQVAEHSGVAIG